MPRLRPVLLGAGLAAAGWTYSRYRTDLARANERIEAGGRVIPTAAGSIEYGEVGRGPPLLMVHGAGGGFDQGLLLARQFGIDPASHRIVAPSRFGYLRTPAPADASPRAQAEAHVALLDALGIREPVPVIGVSAGAPSAMEMAARSPDRVAALLLLVPHAWRPPSAGEEPPRGIGASAFIRDAALRSDLLLWTVLKLAPQRMVTFVGVPPGLQPAMTTEERANARELVDSILPVTRRALGLKLEPTRDALKDIPLADIRAPTLVLDAEDMETFPGSRHLAQRIPHATFVRYPTGGHLLVGHAQEANRAVQDFLAEHAPMPSERERFARAAREA